MDSSFEAAVIQDEMLPSDNADVFVLQIKVEYLPGRSVSVPVTPLLSSADVLAAKSYLYSSGINMALASIQKLAQL
ncbi:MAG: hypothetical protein NT086_19920 [Proteobacteria bacterium]|nr:hypothetical protein [Pseudomonadota bacterium]